MKGAAAKCERRRRNNIRVPAVASLSQPDSIRNHQKFNYLQPVLVPSLSDTRPFASGKRARVLSASNAKPSTSLSEELSR